MAGKEENLRPLMSLTPEERREIARKGGLKSGEARRKARTLSEEVRFLWTKGLTKKEKEDLKRFGLQEEDATLRAAGILAMALEAAQGNVAAFKALAEASGEMVNKHELTGKDGEPLQVEKQMTMEEVREKLRELDEV